MAPIQRPRRKIVSKTQPEFNPGKRTPKRPRLKSLERRHLAGELAKHQEIRRLEAGAPV
jgi:hypothetical protein